MGNSEEKVLTSTDLDKSKCDCGVPGCEDPLVFRSYCHPRHAVEVEYFNQVLTITCHKCAKLIAKVKVARE